MAQQKNSRPVRRYPTQRSNRKAGGHDPYLFVLTAQLAVCALLVLLSYAITEVQPPFMEELRTNYQALISAREIELPVSASFSGVAQRYEEMKNDAADVAASLITDLMTPRTVGAVSSVAEPTAETQGEEEALDGAGGWMGVGEEDSKAAPASCDLSPIILSAWLEPPISGKVTSTFGYRAHPVTKAADFHRGVDIAAVQGSGIYAPLPGRVSEIESSAIYGNYITLDHGNGLTTTYCHCETIVAPLGANLRKGELVATVGSTGISTGPHVHFEISKNGKYYNPAWVLEGMNKYGI